MLIDSTDTLNIKKLSLYVLNKKKKEEIKPVVIEKKTVSFEIKEPSNIGKVDIVFSDYIMMPSSVREWTSDNSGNEHLKLEYIPNTES